MTTRLTDRLASLGAACAMTLAILVGLNTMAAAPAAPLALAQAGSVAPHHA